ncbi:MAG: hypothetical protein ACM3O7_02925 [Acidobacteriota bacterium]
MRGTLIAAVLAVALSGAAVPAQAHQRHSPWLGWSVGVAFGPWWWHGPAYYPVPAASGAQSQLTAVDTDVEPEHARVLLDGRLIGTADDFDGYPDYLYLEPGEYTLEFSLGGFKSETVQIDARPGRFFPLVVKLQRVAGEKETPWYDRPEGMPLGRVFGPSGSGPAPSAPHPDTTLRPELPSREPPAGDSAARPDPQGSVAGAALDLRVTPDNASVYLDGQFVGTGGELGRLQRGLSVAAGHHRVEVLAPGRTPRSVEVDVADGQRQQVVIELDEGLDKPNDRS